MTGIIWRESLDAPRSLATRETLAVTVVEDPGSIDIFGHDDRERTNIETLLGVALPQHPWQSIEHAGRRIVWTGQSQCTLLTSREDAALLEKQFRQQGLSRFVTTTGAFTAFRVVGHSMFELLLRVCPLDLSGVEKDEARGTSIARIPCLLVRERSAVESWLILAPRSLAEYMAEALVEAARTPGPLGLFEPAAPPPV